MACSSSPSVPYVFASQSESKFYNSPTIYQQRLPYEYSAMRKPQFISRPASPCFAAPLTPMMPHFPGSLNNQIPDLKPYGSPYSQYDTGFDYLAVVPGLAEAHSSLQFNPQASEFIPGATDFFNSPRGDSDLSSGVVDSLGDSSSNEFAVGNVNYEQAMPTQLGFPASCYATPANSQDSDCAHQSPITFEESALAPDAGSEHDHHIYPSIESDHINDYHDRITFSQTATNESAFQLPIYRADFDSFAIASLDTDAHANHAHQFAAKYNGDNSHTPSGAGNGSVPPSTHSTKIADTLSQTVSSPADQEITAKLKDGLAIFKKQEGDQITLGSRTAFWTAPARDDTIPTSQAVKDRCHHRLVAAIYNNKGCIETEKSMSFRNRWMDGAKYYTRQEVEAIALELLELIISIHQTGWTKPIYDMHMREEIFKTCLFTFGQRFDALISLLTISKCTCEALLKCERLHAVAGNPWMLDKRVRSNKTSNIKKAGRIAFATAVEKQEQAAQLIEAPQDGKEHIKPKRTKRTREHNDAGDSGAAQVSERPLKRPRRTTRT